MNVKPLTGRRPSPAFWNRKTICVTGGSGFLGYHLVRQLRQLGARVRVFTLPIKADHPLHEFRDIETTFGDVLDPTSARRAVADSDVVFHTAGIVAVWGPGVAKMHAVHVDGTRNMLDACDPKTRIIHTSSVVAVGACPRGTVLDEDSPFGLGGVGIDYVHAKRNAEELALSRAIDRDVLVVNPAYLMGPSDFEPSVIGRFCQRYWRGHLLLAPPGGLNYVDVRDVATGHLLAAEHGVQGRRYILGGENHSWADFMRLLAEAAGLSPRATPTVPSLVLRGLGEIGELRSKWTNREPYPGRQQAALNGFCWYYRSDRAQRELGYAPRPLSETIADTFAWFAERKEFRWKGLNRWWFRPAA